MTDSIRLGLALGSGGARGLAHTGVLDVLEEEGLRPAVITGTSMGALVGGVYAETLDADETWRRFTVFASDPEFLDTWDPFVGQGSASDMERGRFQSLFSSLNRRFMQLRTFTRPALVDEERLRHPLEKLFLARDFAELKLPFAAVGIDLIGGERVIYREGDLLRGIYASAAIPGVFPPLEEDGRLVVDGGGAFRVPLNTCRDMGADVVVAVDIPGFEAAKAEYRTGMDMMLRSDALARERLNEVIMSRADAVIRPDVSDYHWADFRCAGDCRRRGVEAARAALPQIRAAVAQAHHERHGWRARLCRLIGAR